MCLPCLNLGRVDIRHSYTTRLLSTVLPSNWYAKKDASVNAILRALADDLTQLLESGVTVEACGWVKLVKKNTQLFLGLIVMIVWTHGHFKSNGAVNLVVPQGYPVTKIPLVMTRNGLCWGTPLHDTPEDQWAPSNLLCCLYRL